MRTKSIFKSDDVESRRGVTSIESLTLIAAAIVFVVVVTIATRALITQGGETVGSSGGIVTTLKATFAKQATSIIIPTYKQEIPTWIPSSIPSPTSSPTAIPSPSETPTPSPSETPSPSPSPSPDPSPSPSPSPSPAPTCTGDQEIFPSVAASGANLPIDYFVDFWNCSGNSQVFGGRNVFYSGNANSRIVRFRFADLDGATDQKNAIHTSSMSGVAASNRSASFFLNGTIRLSTTTGNTYSYTVHELADFNGDGKDEAIYGGTTCTIAVQDAPTHAALWSDLQITGGMCTLSDIHDYDGDGIKDLLLYNNINSQGGNFTAYKIAPTRIPIWTYSKPSGNASCFNSYEVSWQGNMYGEGDDEVAIGYGAASGSCHTGIVVLDASNGTIKYRFNATRNGVRIIALDSIDANRVGHRDMWIGFDTSRMMWLGNRASELPYTHNTYQIGTSRYPTDLDVGDLDKDGFEDDFIVKTDKIYAYKVNGVGAPTMLWEYSSPGITSNLYPDNTLGLRDINGDGRLEIVTALSSGWIVILDSSGNPLVEFKEPHGLYINSMIASNMIPTSKMQTIDISHNSTDNSTMIGFASHRIASGDEGYAYVYDYEPCKISIDGGPLIAMKWNPAKSKWHFHDSVGLPAGGHQYEISCDGSFGGVGRESLLQSFAV